MRYVQVWTKPYHYAVYFSLQYSLYFVQNDRYDIPGVASISCFFYQYFVLYNIPELRNRVTLSWEASLLCKFYTFNICHGYIQIFFNIIVPNTPSPKCPIKWYVTCTRAWLPMFASRDNAIWERHIDAELGMSTDRVEHTILFDKIDEWSFGFFFDKMF